MIRQSMKRVIPLLLIFVAATAISCRQPLASSPPPIGANSNVTDAAASTSDANDSSTARGELQQKEANVNSEGTANREQGELQTATFGAGCFWCVEAVFQQLEGVESVVSGYSGGFVENPTYQAVCNGETGHAEVCQIKYDPNTITFDELLEVFWRTHDPTTLNRQGADVGTQYRSVIFYHNDEQRQLAEQRKQQLDQSGAWDDPIVTEIAKLEKFYLAEDYHQNYYNENPNAGYCQFVVRPKVEKFKKVFEDKLKKEPAP